MYINFHRLYKRNSRPNIKTVSCILVYTCERIHLDCTSSTMRPFTLHLPLWCRLLSTYMLAKTATVITKRRQIVCIGACVAAYATQQTAICNCSGFHEFKWYTHDSVVCLDLRRSHTHTHVYCTLTVPLTPYLVDTN